MTRRDRQKEAARRYRAMVKAIRQWATLACPAADRLCVVTEDDFGCGDIVATFHARAAAVDEFTRGDLLAMGHRI